MLIYWEFMNKAGVEFHFVPCFFSIAENVLFIKHEEGRDYFLSLMKNFDYQNSKKPIKIFYNSNNQQTKNMKNEFVYQRL